MTIGAREAQGFARRRILMSEVLIEAIDADRPAWGNPQRLLRMRAALEPPFYFASSLLGEFV
jgi:hypothetical protein